MKANLRGVQLRPADGHLARPQRESRYATALREADAEQGQQEDKK